jgi:hypothetical protein
LRIRRQTLGAALSARKEIVMPPAGMTLADGLYLTCFPSPQSANGGGLLGRRQARAEIGQFATFRLRAATDNRAEGRAAVDPAMAPGPALATTRKGRRGKRESGAFN